MSDNDDFAIVKRHAGWSTQQELFVKKVNDIVEDQVDSLNTDDEIDIDNVKDAIRSTASDIINLIEGEDNKRNPGYFLIPKTMKLNDAGLSLEEVSKVNSCSISEGLNTLFENINS